MAKGFSFMYNRVRKRNSTLQYSICKWEKMILIVSQKNLAPFSTFSYQLNPKSKGLKHIIPDDTTLSVTFVLLKGSNYFCIHLSLCKNLVEFPFDAKIFGSKHLVFQFTICKPRAFSRKYSRALNWNWGSNEHITL